MKVVLFCGGLGMRLRDFSEEIPKPMVKIGYRPIIWHLMKYYAHYGHKDFILCLGYKADVIKNYFLNYNECISNDFVLVNGGREVELLHRDIDDWRITFVDTGLHTNIGGRLRAVREHLADEEMFLANYADGLSDLCLPEMIEDFERREAVGSFLCVHPSQRFHLVQFDSAGEMTRMCSVTDSNVWINGGFFAFRNSIFDYLRDGEELVERPFERLIAERKLHAHRYERFWACMDTFKEKQALEDLYASGNAPWAVWGQQSRFEPAEIQGIAAAG